jgi:hypothetical protein
MSEDQNFQVVVVWETDGDPQAAFAREEDAMAFIKQTQEKRGPMLDLMHIPFIGGIE